MVIRTYSKLQKLLDFEERFNYLCLKGNVGEATFGFDRYLNQVLYRSSEWLRIRDLVIIRDDGCDLGHPDYLITGQIVVHHMNPISVNDVKNRDDKIFNMDYLITTTPLTHRAIHYGDASLLPKKPIERYLGDTIPWS